MAHIAKYKATSVGHMLAHYRRDASSKGRENIDPTRTKDNYTLGLDDRDGKVGAMDGIEPNWATVEGRIEGVNKAAKAAGKRAVRKDAVVMADVVVTLPENVRKGDETRAMRVYTDKSADIDKVRGAVERGIVEPAERQAAQAVEDAAQRVEEARAELDELKGAVSAEQARLESLRQGTRAIERDVAELRPIAAEIGRWEAADRAGKRAILDSIAARCAGAARAARAAIEELGDRIRALMRPRKAQRTLGDVMREAADAELAAKALSSNHVAPTNSRQRGQAR